MQRGILAQTHKETKACFMFLIFYGLFYFLPGETDLDSRKSQAAEWK